MESHDEERLMYKNLQHGNSSGDYNIKELATALNRQKMAAAFFLILPGPKMIWQFGEVGYDVSIDDPCRVCDKPIRWNYYAEADRLKLYKTYSALLRLRRDHNVFRDGGSTVDLWLDDPSGVKRIRLSNYDMKVVIVGNFGVVADSIDPNFHYTGTWYDFFMGDTVQVNDIHAMVPLAPGDFHIYTDKWVESPEEGLVVLSAESVPSVPGSFALYQNYPNPFNPTSTIRFDLPQAGYASLIIYDILGREMARLADGYSKAGYHQVSWDGRDAYGRQVSSGIYIAQLVTPEHTMSIKMVLLK
jgi:hypothetical protein